MPEDPATGSAAVGLGMALVATGVLPAGGRYEVTQGVEMGRPSRLLGRVEAVGRAVTRCHVAGRVFRVARGTRRRTGLRVSERPAAPLAGSTLGLLAVGVVAVSMSGPVMASLAVPALVISFWRNGLATLVLAPVALLRRRTEIAGLSRSELGWIVASGRCLAVHFGTWVTSLRMTSVASSTAIVCLQIAWVVAWDRFTGVRLPRRAVVGAGAGVRWGCW